MSRKRKKFHESLTYQVKNKLESKLAIGESKHKDKEQERAILAAKRETSPKAWLTYEERICIHKIYSWGTFKSYLKHACYFTKWCKHKYNCKILDECRQYVNEWLSIRSSLSAYTQKLEASALAKIFDCTTNEFIPTGTRRREDITRSREKSKKDHNFSKLKNKEFIDFCKTTGLRKSELKCLHDNNLICRNGIYYICGCHGAKGSRYRESPIISNIEMVVKRMQSAEYNKVWSYVPDLDVHSLRSQYCSDIYNTLARPLEQIPRNERYYCRRDLKGICYDKRAMLIASKCLGHNRISIIAEQLYQIVVCPQDLWAFFVFVFNFKLACHIDVNKQTTFVSFFNITGGHINMLNELSVLKEAYECGILDATEVARKIYMTKESYIKQHHSYSIHIRKDGRYISTVRKEDENRQQISAQRIRNLL